MLHFAALDNETGNILRCLCFLNGDPIRIYQGSFAAFPSSMRPFNVPIRDTLFLCLLCPSYKPFQAIEARPGKSAAK